jgi:peptide/nickel transport system substrate-binding protein
MDGILDDTRSATDPEKRKELFIEAAGVAAEDLPDIYLYHQAPIFAFKSTIEGLYLTR